MWPRNGYQNVLLCKQFARKQFQPNWSNPPPPFFQGDLSFKCAHGSHEGHYMVCFCTRGSKYHMSVYASAGVCVMVKPGFISLDSLLVWQSYRMVPNPLVSWFSFTLLSEPTPKRHTVKRCQTLLSVWSTALIDWKLRWLPLREAWDWRRHGFGSLSPSTSCYQFRENVSKQCWINSKWELRVGNTDQRQWMFSSNHNAGYRVAPVWYWDLV